MKKWYTTQKFRKLNERRSRDRLARQIEYKRWRRNVNRRLSKQKQEDTRLARHNLSEIEAPTQFSFLKNTEGMIQFIKQIEENLTQEKGTYIAMEDVEYVDYSAIVVLLSIMVLFRTHRIPFNGSFPRAKAQKEKFINSGFFERLYERQFQPSDRYEIKGSGGDGIHTHAFKKVDSKLGAEIVRRATEFIFGEPVRSQGVQRTLIELMLNTNNHSVIGKKGDKFWWLIVEHDDDLRRVKFTFVDFGVGIFRSLRNKGPRSKFYNWHRKVIGNLSFTNDAELLRLILQGELHRTVTGKRYRGKGLPGIHETFQRGQIDNLCIISNDVKADLRANSYSKLNAEFDGTLVHWELGYHNVERSYRQNIHSE